MRSNFDSRDSGFLEDLMEENYILRESIKIHFEDWATWFY